MKFAFKAFLVSTAFFCASTAAYGQAVISTLPLPQAVEYPEGVAVSPVDGRIYVNAASSGTMARLDPSSGTSSVIASPLLAAHAQLDGVKALGLKIDQANRAWIAGGMTGAAYVVDIDSGSVLARYTSPEGNTLINDVVITPQGAFFTDTRRPILWRANANNPASGALEPWLELNDTNIPYIDGANLNGITATADGRYLIVVHMQRGDLYRIDTLNREVSKIQVTGGALDGGDGLLLSGQRLYLVRQPHQEVVALNLTNDLLQATVHKRLNPPELAWPATAAFSGSNLIIGNSQLNKRASNTPERPFNLGVIPLSLFD